MAALGQLAAGLAHELRNPLTAMKILIQAAVEARAAAGLSGRDLAVLDAETARLERSIQTFLDFARPPKLEKRPGDIRQAFQQTLELVRARANRQGVQIECESGRRPLGIEADHEQLRQVFLNLLFNALDALPQRRDASRPPARSVRAPGAGGATLPARCPRRPRVVDHVRSPTTGRAFPGARRPDLRALCEHQGDRASAWDWPFAGGSSRPTAARSPRPTPPRAAPCSPSGFPANRPPMTTPDRTTVEQRLRRGNVMPSLLIVDDEPNVCYSLEKALRIAETDDLARPAPPGKESSASAATRPTP